MTDSRQLELTFEDASALYLAYMPFVRNGGLFAATNGQYELGDELLMSLGLMGNPEQLVVSCRVVWITPEGTQGQQPVGIGVQFDASDRGETRKCIEDCLSGASSGDRSTHTM